MDMVSGLPAQPDKNEALDEVATGSTWRRLLRRVDWGAYGIVIGTIVLWVIFDVATNGLFLSPRNLTLLMVQGVVLGIIASGAVLVMVMGHIDLSVGSTVGFTATIAGWLQAIQGWSTPPTLLVVGIVGIAIGAWQGAWIAYAGIPAFIVTLAGMSLFRGLSYVMSNGQTFAPMSSSFETIANGSLLPSLSLILILAAIVLFLTYLVRTAEVSTTGWHGRFNALATSLVKGTPLLAILVGIGFVSTAYRGIPYAVLIMAAVALALAFVSQRTRFGRHLYAIGGNREAAVLSGINVARHTFVTFVGMGFLYAMGGMVLASRLDGAVPDAALGLELDVITACILGGTSLFGGIGTVQGAILGALLLTTLNNGMDLIGFSTFAQWVVKGTVLLVAVLLDVWLKKRQMAAA